MSLDDGIQVASFGEDEQVEILVGELLDAIESVQVSFDEDEQVEILVGELVDVDVEVEILAQAWIGEILFVVWIYV